MNDSVFSAICFTTGFIKSDNDPHGNALTFTYFFHTITKKAIVRWPNLLFLLVGDTGFEPVTPAV